MLFFFTRDSHRHYRFFSTEPTREVQVEFSKLKKIWAAAKEKLLLLPPRILRQEQAFQQILNLGDEGVTILHGGADGTRRIRIRFFFFLQKQRSKHFLLLLVETLLLPLSGLMALVPGPNVFFGVLALILVTHWQAFRGINRLRKKHIFFRASPLLQEWEKMPGTSGREDQAAILSQIEQKHRITEVAKILLW